jgi:hypothetical protein
VSIKVISADTLWSFYPKGGCLATSSKKGVSPLQIKECLATIYSQDSFDLKQKESINQPQIDYILVK